MAMPEIELRGCAVVFDQVARCGDWLEYIDPACFDAQLATGRAVDMQFALHGTAPIGQCTLCRDGFGVWFRGQVSLKDWAQIGPEIARSVNFCSVFLANPRANEQWLDDEACYRIIAGRIEHVCLTSDPIYLGTAVWSLALQGRAPARVRRLMPKWSAAFARHYAAEHRRIRAGDNARRRVQALLVNTDRRVAPSRPNDEERWRELAAEARQLGVQVCC
jgi:hypothetical protein